jgi:hypothetical protein
MERKHFIDRELSNSTLILQPAPNGGWVVKEVAGHFGEKAKTIGAYSTHADMIEALSDMVV